MNHGYTLIEYGKHEFNPHYGWLEDKYGLTWHLSLSENAEDSKIKPTLLFTNDRNGNAEEAAKFYTEIFLVLKLITHITMAKMPMFISYFLDLKYTQWMMAPKMKSHLMK